MAEKRLDSAAWMYLKRVKQRLNQISLDGCKDLSRKKLAKGGKQKQIIVYLGGFYCTSRRIR